MNKGIQPISILGVPAMPSWSGVAETRCVAVRLSAISFVRSSQKDAAAILNAKHTVRYKNDLTGNWSAQNIKLIFDQRVS